MVHNKTVRATLFACLLLVLMAFIGCGNKDAESASAPTPPPKDAANAPSASTGSSNSTVPPRPKLDSSN